MNKLYIILALIAAASTVFILLPGVLDHVAHYIHWVAIVTSGHHVCDEVAHAIHPKKAVVVNL